MSTEKIEKEISAAKRILDPFVEEVERIVFAKHSEPFQILGPHWVERNGVRSLAVRAFRPGATGLDIVWRSSGAIYPARLIHSDSFFEATLPPESLRSPKRARRRELRPTLTAFAFVSPTVANSKRTTRTPSRRP